MNIVIVGVGGQGTLLASRILGSLAINAGMDVKVSEVHGMSQRGGSVITHVRMNREQTVRSPLIEQGGADAILSMEKLEALRALPYLKVGGLLVTNTQEILPLPVVIGFAEYPQDIIERLESSVCLKAIDALTLAREAGSQRTANVVLMGALSREMPFSIEEWETAIRECVPAAAIESNLKAFRLGASA